MMRGNNLKHFICLGLIISLGLSLLVGDGYQFTYRNSDQEVILLINAKSAEQWTLLNTLILMGLEMYSKKFNS